MKTSFQLSKIAAALTVVGGVSFFSGQTMAAAPLAGTNISNVATATYTDNTGTERVVTSNEVKTIVAQVGSFTLVEDREAQTTPNGQVTYSHILTNTGNGTDKFNITLTDIDNSETTFDFSEGGKFAVYIDRNKDGVADDQVALKPETLIELAAGESVGLVVVATTPSTAKDGSVDKLQLTATVDSNSTVTYVNNEKSKSNTDTTTITTGAVMQITKAASVSTAKAGDEITYTLTFKNTGNATATNVAIFDVLPTTVEYVAGSALYSGSSAKLTDADDVTDKFQYDSTKRAFLFNIPSVAANTTGKLTFKVKIKETTSAGNIQNTAYVDPNGKPGDDPSQPNVPLTIEDIPSTPNEKPNDPDTVPSNPSIVAVVGTYNGSINDSKKDDFKDGEKPTVEGAVGDDVISLEGQQGLPVVFGGADAAEGSSIVVHNSGNSTDTYNLTITESSLPKGSIVEILKADGKTPAVDTNGDGIVDTGPIASGEAAEFTVRVTLPTGQVISQPVGVTLSSKSVNDPTLEADTLKLVIESLLKNEVDLTSKTPEDSKDPVKGEGPGTEEPVTEKTTPPGKPVEFDITIGNQGNVPDNYIITVPDVPTGWTVEIFEKNGDECTTTKVSNSGNIAAGGEKSFCVVVTPPAGTPAGTDENIKVEISSPATGTKDDITFEVTVEEQRQLTFTPDRQGQVAPGGTIVYTHTLTNTGNVTEGLGGEDYALQIEWSSTLEGVNTSVYIDANGNGVLDSDELVVGNTPEERNASVTDLLSKTNGTGLSQNESVTVFVKVEAPATATHGVADTSVITFKPTGDNKPADVSITDRTVVTLGQVRLTKTQGLSADCTTAPTTYVTTDLKAEPGQCVFYKITAANDGNEDAKTIVISDSVPSYTTLQPGSLKPTEAKESNGQISYTVDLLKPAESVDLQFGVKVDTETK
ncbi:DUF11 domain-containing protein [Acinetobacter sp. dk771]|uniref:DUF11 domain-containing protein n=1 Tax=Acinetobacter wanghuae TaxID=2662362 RepID=A0AA91AF07_9GAMM|nr:DUF11 domain-containing protein [Acinetobacter wanghuae]MQW92009.1 DUF11 domain-containing protein [Acinetobacter wanghuae]